MRTLEINKSKLWIVEKASEQEVQDSDGNPTGETEFVYTTPVEVKIALYPASGSVLERTFGKDATLDMLAISDSVVLTKDSLLFLTQPTADIDLEASYDYRVQSILHSLNVYNYGLRRRT